MKVAKWGNSLAVRLSKEAAEMLGLVEGDDLQFEITADGEVKVRKEGGFTDWLEQMRRYEGRLPAGFRFDREDANRRD